MVTGGCAAESRSATLFFAWSNQASQKRARKEAGKERETDRERERERDRKTESKVELCEGERERESKVELCEGERERETSCAVRDRAHTQAKHRVTLEVGGGATEKNTAVRHRKKPPRRRSFSR